MATIAKAEVTDPWRFVLLSGIFHTIQFIVAGAGLGLAFGRLETAAAGPAPTTKQ